jgi:hypothetical protein
MGYLVFAPLTESLTMAARNALPDVFAEGTVPAPDLLLDPAFPYGEDLLQFIWETGLYDAKALRTTDDEPLEVLHAGRIQPHGGPDLNDARIRIAGQEWAGPVEVHLRSSDWNAHGHQRDPAYNNVVLHAVYRHDAEVRTENGRRPPTVALQGRINEGHLHLHQALMTERRGIPCAAQVHRVGSARMGLWLERLLIQRLERKTKEVESIYRATGNDPQETLHHILLRCLGKPVNGEPFAMLAHALPLKLLLKYRDDALRVEALLLGQAGFLDGAFTEDHPLRLQQEYRGLAHLHGLRPGPEAAWKFGRLRPPNFPTVRLAQWAVFMAGHGFDRLLAYDDPAEIRALLDVEATGYWRHHYRPGLPADPKPKRLGRAMADSLILNAIVPCLFTMGRVRGHQRCEHRALALLERLPAEENSIIKEWRGLGVKAVSAGQSQALIELRGHFCAERKCLSCGVGMHLHKLVAVQAPVVDHGEKEQGTMDRR